MLAMIVMMMIVAMMISVLIEEPQVKSSKLTLDTFICDKKSGNGFSLHFPKHTPTTKRATYTDHDTGVSIESVPD